MLVRLVARPGLAVVSRYLDIDPGTSGPPHHCTEQLRDFHRTAAHREPRFLGNVHKVCDHIFLPVCSFSIGDNKTAENKIRCRKYQELHEKKTDLTTDTLQDQPPY